MATIRLISDAEANDEVAAVYADIRTTRGTDFINDFWRALANDPVRLKSVWEEVKTVMAPGALDPLTKELVYIAISAANACPYCVHSHTASARAKGMTDAQHSELIGVIALAGKTNHLANTMQLEPDSVFRVENQKD